MTSFVIRTEDEEDLGFLLFAAHDGQWPPSGENECVFNGFPYDPWLLDDPRARFVMEQKGQEWIAAVDYTDRDITVHFNLSAGWVFELCSNESGNSWTAARDGEAIHGTGMFL